MCRLPSDTVIFSSADVSTIMLIMVSLSQCVRLFGVQIGLVMSFGGLVARIALVVDPKW